MTHYHVERKRAAVEVYREVKRLKKEEKGKPINAIALASVAAGGASERRIREWLTIDLSDNSISQKEEKRGAAPVLEEDEENLLIGFAISTRTSLQPLTLSMLESFCFSYIQKKVSQSTLFRIMQKNGFSSQKAMTRSSRMVSTETVDDALSFIEKIRKYDFPPHRMIFMDETGLWSNVVAPRTYHFSNWYDILILLISSVSPQSPFFIVATI